ncbi:alpha-tocopherol transfer protein-like [Liolophura sinensis]|uniref:alpha-tocopherol transfer protein-like n=1 Tax=Liolophura sinensis TaxID=3198878 RepID=UPI003158A83E
MPVSEKYECTLDKDSVKKAQKELGEDPKERESAVASLRQWIEQNSAWLKSPTDTKFLLRFLRNAKFAQLAARKRLVSYWTSRTNNKEWFGNVDTRDKTMEECLRMGNFMPLPKRDQEGRVIILGKPAAIDVSGKYTIDDIMKASGAVVDYCLMDENVQVNGFSMIQDMSDLTLKHQSFFGVDAMRRSMKVWVKSYPARYKNVHYYNTNPIFEAIFAIISPIFPEKLQKRLYFHGKNLFGIYKHIDQVYLPTEYLPDDFKGKNVGSVNDCIDDYIQKMQQPEVRDYLLHLSSPEFGVSQDLKPSDDELFNESFRKLNVD